VPGEIDKLQIGLAERVARWSVAVWAAAAGGTILLDTRAACGIALGGGLSLGLFSLHRALIGAWARPERWRRRRAAFWMIWAVKWPAVATLLYFAVRGGWVSVGWLCAGVGLVPAVTTALVVRALVADGRRPRSAAEAGG